MTEARSASRAPVFFAPHGGGPMPLLGEPNHQPVVDLLQSLPARWPKPSAVLVISAHWEEAEPTLLAADDPGLYYDYYGFPEESYRIRYPVTNPEPWRAQVAAALSDAGLAPREDAARGYDHGVFVPLKLMYPDADLPVLQLSLLSSLDAAAHLRLGQALAPLRDAGLLILGSGFTFHNMRAFDFSGGGGGPQSKAFHDWLVDSLTAPGLAPDERLDRLAHWAEAPQARFCHPREEHLLPLHVCLGAAGGEAAEIVFDQPLLGQRAIGALWR